MSTDKPKYGMTLQAPWAHLIVHGPKRLENRREAVATMARKIIGERLALTCSKVTLTQARRALLGNAAPLIPPDWPVTAERLVADSQHMIGTARISAVRSPEDVAGDPWHKPKQWAIMLDDVVALETPIPATGNLDIWRAWYCSCGRIVAKGSSCRACTPPMRRRR